MGIPFLDLPDFGQSIDSIAARTGLTPEQIRGFVRGPRSVPNTRARLSHAYTIRTSRGRLIGGIYSVQASQGRTVDTEFEIDVNAHGEPADVIPQELNERTLSVSMWDLYSRVAEAAFTDFEIEMLTDQASGLKVREVWRAPTGILNSSGAHYEYRNCYFTRLGRTVSATDDRVVKVNAEMIWTNKRKIA